MPLERPSRRDNCNDDQTSTVHIYTGGKFQTVSYEKKRDSPKRAVDVKKNVTVQRPTAKPDYIVGAPIRGLMDLGNTYQRKSYYQGAERHFNDALALALRA